MGCEEVSQETNQIPRSSRAHANQQMVSPTVPRTVWALRQGVGWPGSLHGRHKTQTPVLNLPFFRDQFLHLLNGALDQMIFKDLSDPRGHGVWGLG